MKRSGFTLIELLVVLVIMAALAGAMMPMIAANRVRAQQAKVQGDLDAIKTAAMMMHTDCGTGIWPTGAEAPGTTSGDGIIDDLPTCLDADNWDGPYLDIWGTNPWGFSYAIVDGGIVPPIIRSIISYGAGNAVGGTGAAADLTLRMTPDITK